MSYALNIKNLLVVGNESPRVNRAGGTCNGLEPNGVSKFISYT